VEVVASLSQGRTAAAQCGFFTYKSVPVIFETPCIVSSLFFPSSINILPRYLNFGTCFRASSSNLILLGIAV